jgi:hypothetical protein
MALNGTAATRSQEISNFPTRLPFKREPRFFADIELDTNRTQRQESPPKGNENGPQKSENKNFEKNSVKNRNLGEANT